MADLPHLGFVVLVNAAGQPIQVFETDRVEFQPLATFLRDRVFRLYYAGDLTGMFDLPASMRGAIYTEEVPWRISLKTMDDHRGAAPRRRRTAKILPFVRRTA